MSKTEEVVRSTLKVRGAKLYYEVQGTGPVLFMIPGGPTDAGIFAALAACLGERFTVVRYDPRGNSRSVLDGPPEDQNMDVHGDDAAQLLDVVGDGPAYVLGSSGGAQIGLNLAARHPQSVKTLVAHEPPCIQLLPDVAEQRAFTEGVYETFRTSGVGAAMQKFMVSAGLTDGRETERVTPPHPEMREATARIQGNLGYFIEHGFEPISRYVPDIAALKAGPVRIVVGVGATSAGQLANRTAEALAERLGIAPVIFAGGHGGYNEHAVEFAEKLTQVIS